VISDTHGLVRGQALAALAGCELILHAGDVGTPEVLERLREIAPVRAVRGNNDRGDWAHSLPLNDVIEIGAHHVYLLHDIAELEIDPAAAKMAAVITGHSHKPSAQVWDGVLYLNPGSAGPRRFKLPIAIARLRVSRTGIEHEIIELSV
jgi:putative phosphoesterase